MRGLRKVLTPFAPDASGAVSVLYALGGMVVILDAGGCTGNICGFDEPRWQERKSAVFSAGLRDMDAILGRDTLLVQKIQAAAQKLEVSFIALIGTPVPAVIATDITALAAAVEKATNLPVLAVPTTGFALYDAGIQKAYQALLARWPQEGNAGTAGRHKKILGVWGWTPLDFPKDYAAVLAAYARKRGFDGLCLYGETDGISGIQNAGAAAEHLVISPAGLKAAQHMQKAFGVPCSTHMPPLRPLAEIGPGSLGGKRICIVHQQCIAHAFREEILRCAKEQRADPLPEVTVGTWFLSDPVWRQPGDVSLREEEDFTALVSRGAYNIIIGDPLLKELIPDFNGVFIPVSHTALSGMAGESREAASPSVRKKTRGGHFHETKKDTGLAASSAGTAAPQTKTPGETPGDGKEAGSRTTERIRVFGIVQGVGFRPQVARHAKRFGILGSVCNRGPYVEIWAKGSKAARDAFAAALEAEPPVRAHILKVEREEHVRPPADFTAFSIALSEPTKGEIFIPPDIAVCPACEKELYDPRNRRYLHPFINCTACGPRLTILEALPYDRERTSMKAFPMCGPCEKEYRSPKSRRFDAQPVCCPDCGPVVYILEKDGRRRETGEAAILRARKTLFGGGIVAVKGIGGFHLAARADKDEAVKRLRVLKQRPAKPFAVMMKNLACVRACCETDAAAEKILTGHQKPILLLPKKETAALSGEVAPGNPAVGIMLPYAPLQHLLFHYPGHEAEDMDALVMTSGNVAGAPICREDDEARATLAGFCDLFLSHNREIRTRCDDSVADMAFGRIYMIRRSRGYAPLPLMANIALEGDVLAVGGELKNTFCVGKGNLFYPSSYIGDLSDVRSTAVLTETIERYLGLLEAKPRAVAADLHPAYRSAKLAGQLSERFGVPLLTVQHHYAHILSCMAENKQEAPVIGVAFDGTGYGTDGSIWGGEILACTLQGFRRLAHITPFMHVGGDAASKEGWRVALSMLYAVTKDPQQAAERAQRIGLCGRQQAKAALSMQQAGINVVASTSCGRLFDAVAAVLGLCRASTFEGEAAMALQFAAEAREKRHGKLEAAAFRMETMATDRLFAHILAMREENRDPGEAALFFHEALAELTAGAVKKAVHATGIQTAALSGGCFQNRLLLQKTVEKLRAAGLKVLVHHTVPPNDGGIALGQALYAAAQSGRQGRRRTKKEGERVCVWGFRQGC